VSDGVSPLPKGGAGSPPLNPQLVKWNIWLRLPYATFCAIIRRLEVTNTISVLQAVDAKLNQIKMCMLDDKLYDKMK